jgi:hypothetical protein
MCQGLLRGREGREGADVGLIPRSHRSRVLDARIGEGQAECRMYEHANVAGTLAGWIHINSEDTKRTDAT